MAQISTGIGEVKKEMNENELYKHNVERLIELNHQQNERIELIEKKIDEIFHLLEVVASYPLTPGQFNYVFKLIEKAKKEE